MMNVHTSIRKALSILTFVGMFMSSTGVAFVPVAQAQGFDKDHVEEFINNKFGGSSMCIDDNGDIHVSANGEEKIIGLSKIVSDLKDKYPFISFLINSDRVKDFLQNFLEDCENSGDDEEDNPPVVVNNTGTIEVCKVVIDENNVIVEDDDTTFIFSYDVFERITTNKKEDVGKTPRIGDNQTLYIGTSNCTSVTIDMGEEDVVDVVYEEIELSGDYELVGYHDRYSGPVTTEVVSAVLDNPAPTTVDNHDGHVVLNKGGNRSILVVNRLLDGDEPQVPVDSDLTATVQMCKLDTKENSLSGWQLALLGDKVTDVSVNSKTNKNAGSSVKATLTSGDYVAKATGTFEYRSGTNLTADARFSERLPSDATYGGPYSPWATSSSGTAWLHMDGDATVWGDVFSPSHIYYAPITLTSDRDVEFYIGDNQHKDNKGNLTVDIYNGYTGVTDDNGCVTFESVPYGNYTVEELLQPEWENESGLGAVTIDSEYVVLSVMNQGPEEPIGQCTLQGDAKWASEVVSFDQGKRKDGTDVLAVRSDSSKALGVDDAADTNYDYVSLGFGGEIVLSFDYEIIDGPGDDFMVYETSTGNPSFNSYPEKADVYASQTGADGSWVLIGEAQHDTAFDLGGKINNVRFIKIVDTSETTQFGADADGFDVAGVEILYCGDEIDDDEPGDEVVTKRSQISISGTVYEDAELNDCYNMGTCKNEAGVLEGWTMRLYDSSWDLMQTAVSGADGIFKFSGFWVEEPGTVYVCEVLQDGWTQQTQTWSGSGYLVNTPNGSGETDEGPYCRTVNYASTGNYSNKSRFGNVNTADNDGDEEPGDFSISGTKTEVINGDEAMSEGWEIELYRLVDTVEVNSENSTAVSSSVSLNNSAQYLLEVSGTYKFGNPNRRADAEYISELGDWTDVANDTYEDDFLDLLVDGVARDWGEFDSSHTYYLPFAGTGSAASFLIKDRAFAYGDNEGVLTVRIFELADTDTTNNDGEYSFDDLEEGTYLVREVNQEGWTQVMPEIGHCELSLSANNPDDECDFVNRQDSDVPTNPQEGILKVQKLVLGTNTTGTGNFEITVTCESEFGETFLLGANGYKEFTLPAGDSCTVSETNPEGAVVSFSPDSTVTIVAGETRLVNVINDFSGSDGNNDGDDGDDNRGTASSTSSRGFASSRVLGDSTSAVDDDNGEVLGATTSIYPGMPNAGNATPFASVIVVQSLLIAAALLYYNRKVFVTRTENN